MEIAWSTVGVKRQRGQGRITLKCIDINELLDIFDAKSTFREAASRCQLTWLSVFRRIGGAGMVTRRMAAGRCPPVAPPRSGYSEQWLPSDHS